MFHYFLECHECFNYDDESNIDHGIYDNQLESYEILSEMNTNGHEEHNQQDLICTALLSLFYSGKFSRDAFQQIIEFTRLLVDIQIPKTFDMLMQRVSETKIDYTKQFYCQTCEEKVEVKKLIFLNRQYCFNYS